MLKHNLRQINESILTFAYVFIDSILLNKIRQEVFVKWSCIFCSKCHPETRPKRTWKSLCLK